MSFSNANTSANSATAAATNRMSLMPVMAPLSDLHNFTAEDGDEEEQDAEEEKKLMNILLRLKTAQSSMDENRKRKHHEEVTKDTLQKYRTQRQALVDKHKARWSAKLGTLNKRCAATHSTVKQSIKALDEETKACESTIKSFEMEIKRVIDDLTALEMDCLHLKQQQNAGGSDDDVGSDSHDEFTRVAEMVRNKLEELHSVLQKVQSQSVKEDRFTKVMKTFMASM